MTVKETLSAIRAISPVGWEKARKFEGRAHSNSFKGLHSYLSGDRGKQFMIDAAQHAIDERIAKGQPVPPHLLEKLAMAQNLPDAADVEAGIETTGQKLCFKNAHYIVECAKPGGFYIRKRGL